MGIGIRWYPEHHPNCTPKSPSMGNPQTNLVRSGHSTDKSDATSDGDVF